MKNTNNNYSTETEGEHGPPATAPRVQPGDGRIFPDNRQVTDWLVAPHPAQEENDRLLIGSVAVRHGKRSDLWLGKPKVAIAWAAVANRVWSIPAYNGKYRQYPVRNGGGFGIQASRPSRRIRAGKRPLHRHR